MTYLDQPPHTLHADLWAEGDLHNWRADCPHDGKGADRWCKVGIEPTEPCEWWRWELGDHHPDCGYEQLCEDSGPHGDPGLDSAWPCWAREPEECEGFYVDEIGHAHLDEGTCGLDMYLREVGVPDAAAFSEDIKDVTLPLKVRMWWDGPAVVMEPVAGGGS